MAFVDQDEADFVQRHPRQPVWHADARRWIVARVLSVVVAFDGSNFEVVHLSDVQRWDGDAETA
jgi:hypothetical protein